MTHLHAPPIANPESAPAITLVMVHSRHECAKMNDAINMDMKIKMEAAIEMDERRVSLDQVDVIDAVIDPRLSYQDAQTLLAQCAPQQVVLPANLYPLRARYCHDLEIDRYCMMHPPGQFLKRTF
jgi:hypothetical protein